MFNCGHFTDELWGLCASPNNEFYATGGDDMVVMKWDVINKKRVAWYKHDKKIRALDWASNDEFIVVGDYEGHIVLLDAKDLTKLDNYQFTRKVYAKISHWIEDLKISPDCKMVALGTHGGASKLDIIPIDGKKLGKARSYNIGFTSAL